MPVSWKNNIYSGNGVAWDTEEYSGNGFCDEYEGGDYEGGDYEGGDFDGGMYYEGEGKGAKQRRKARRIGKDLALLQSMQKTMSAQAKRNVSRVIPNLPNLPTKKAIQMGKDLALMQSIQKTMSAQAQRQSSRVIPNLPTKTATKKPKKKTFLTCMLPLYRKLPEETRGSFATFLKDASKAQKKSCVGTKKVVKRTHVNPFLNCMSNKYAKRDDKKVMWRSFLSTKKSLCKGKSGYKKDKPMTVVELKDWASGKIKGFSTMRKAELEKAYKKYHAK